MASVKNSLKIETEIAETVTTGPVVTLAESPAEEVMVAEATVVDAAPAKKTRKPRAKKTEGVKTEDVKVEGEEKAVEAPKASKVRKPRAVKAPKEKKVKTPKAPKEKKPKAEKKVKAPKEPKEKKEPKSGQSGPVLDLTKDKLNTKEVKVVSVLHDDVNPLPITAIASTAFGDQTPGTANSWVRNSLRRLARGRWIEKMGKGTYRLTEMGTSRLEGKDVTVPSVEVESEPAVAMTA